MSFNKRKGIKSSLLMPSNNAIHIKHIAKDVQYYFNFIILEPAIPGCVIS